MFVLLICVVCLIVALTVARLKIEKYAQMRHSTRCFSCERQAKNAYGDDGVWMANPSKTFSAERDGVRRYGMVGGYLGKTVPFFQRCF
jgi:hypothetical protein